MDDKVLIEATLQGDQASFEQLVRRYQAALVASACHLTRHADDAEDLAQETLVEAYRRLGSLREPAKFRGWLFAILHSKCLNHLKRHRTELSLEECGDVFAAPPALDDGEVADLLNRLPIQDREVLAARYLYGLEYEEIADALGIKMHTAQVRCLRARERLRSLMQQADEERTRLLMQRAMGVLLVGGISASFAHRVLQEVHTMQLAMASHAEHAVSGQAAGLKVAAHLAGWKIAAGIIAVLVIGGTGLVWHFLGPAGTPAADQVTINGRTGELLNTVADIADAGPKLDMVQGQVLTPEGKPEPGARVAWIGRADEFGDSDYQQLALVTTDDEGKFSFPDSDKLWEQSGRSNSAQLMVETEAWGLTFCNIPKNNQSVAITLEQPTRFRVTFVDQHNTPVSDLSVSLYFLTSQRRSNQSNFHFLKTLPDPRQRFTQRTDRNGQCTFTNLPRHGTAVMRINDDRFVQLEDSTEDNSYGGMANRVKLSNGPETPMTTFQVLPGASIEGSVTYAATGKPAAGLQIKAYMNEFGNEAVTDAEGHYRIQQLRHGSYRVFIDADGVVEKTWAVQTRESVPVAAGTQVKGVDFALEPGAVLSGKVTAADTGAPIANVFIWLSSPTSPEFTPNGSIILRTDADGNYLCHVMTGKYNLRLYCNPPAVGFRLPARPKRSVTVEDDDTATINFSLPRENGGR